MEPGRGKCLFKNQTWAENHWGVPQLSNISCELSLRRGCGTKCSEKTPADTEWNFTQNQSLSRRRERERTVLPNPCITDTLTDERMLQLWLTQVECEISRFTEHSSGSDHLKWSKEGGCESVKETGDSRINSFIQCLDSWEQLQLTQNILLSSAFPPPCRTAGIFGRALEQLSCQRGRSAVRWSGARQGLVLMCW